MKAKTARMVRNIFRLLLVASRMMVASRALVIPVPPAFVRRPSPSVSPSFRVATSLAMSSNWFQKALEGAFANEAFASPPEGVQATARHILVHTQSDCEVVLEHLRRGRSFGDVAHEFSACPSKAHGGSLGRFGPGTMVAEFDRVIFDPRTPVGEVVGPVHTDFGYHFVVIDKRTGL